MIKGAAKVVHAHREAKRAHADGASLEAQKRYQKAVIRALDELDPLVVAAAKEASAERRDTPFDWNGVFRAIATGMKLVDRIKSASPTEVAQIIDAEVVGVKDVRR
jgi:hypothetical protein